ncbi:hypothetical protein GLU64_02670 [Nanohaloarchaea archaeon]|nr:hypothetical protein [Candidatus Nanohaloarchaea archaeon]
MGGFEYSEEVQSILQGLSRDGALYILFEVYGDNVIPSEYDQDISKEYCELQEQNLLEKGETFSFEKRNWVTEYSDTERGRHLVDTLEEYDVGTHQSDENPIIDSFQGRSSDNWANFLATIEEGQTISDHNKETFYRYLREGEDLGIIEGKGENEISEVTDRGREVKEFIREVGEELGDAGEK